MLGFVSAHIRRNAISYPELQRLYKALHDDLVLLSATTSSNICLREYALTVDSIKKQLLVRNPVSLALDSWTSTNKLPIKSVISYYMARNWALCEVQLAFVEVDGLVSSRFKRYFRMIGQGPRYCSKASRTYEGLA
jgi:hypothetical protein